MKEQKEQRRHGPGYKNVQNGPINSIPSDFISNQIAPDNNSFFDYESNPLSSKGNSILREERDLFDPKPEREHPE